MWGQVVDPSDWKGDSVETEKCWHYHGNSRTAIMWNIIYIFFLSITYFHLASHILWLILFILFSSRYYTQGLNLSPLPTDSMREFIKHSSPWIEMEDTKGKERKCKFHIKIGGKNGKKWTEMGNFLYCMHDGLLGRGSGSKDLTGPCTCSYLNTDDIHVAPLFWLVVLLG